MQPQCRCAADGVGADASPHGQRYPTDPATAAAACLVAAPATDGRPGFDNRRRLSDAMKPVETWDIHP